MLTVGYFHAFSNEFMYFLWKYTAYDITDMVSKCAAPKYQTGYTSSTGKLSSFHLPLKNEELNKKRIRFVNRSDWVPTKHSVLFEFHFEYIYKNKGNRMSLNWSMKLVLRSIKQELLIRFPFFRPLKHLDSLLEKGFSRRINYTLSIHMTILTH